MGLQLEPPKQHRLANPQRLWRNPDLAHKWFSEATSEGTDGALVWHLRFEARDATHGTPLSYSFVVHGNGTILELRKGAAVLAPVKQFYRPTVGPGPSFA